MENPPFPRGSPHLPVMVMEVLRWLDPKPGEVFLDATLGFGGHAERIADCIKPDGRLIGLDVDPSAIEYCQKKSQGWSCGVHLVRAGYEDAGLVLSELKIGQIDGILVDLGISSAQVDRAERGFSFRNDGPLDMRMDPDQSLSAADWLESASEADIRRVLHEFGEEKRAGAIARAILRKREKEPIRTTRQLAEVVLSCFPDKGNWNSGIHPATRTFQALRILINRELEKLEQLLDQIPSLLKPGGRMVILAYHSLEDRRVKQAIQKWSGTPEPEFRRLPTRREVLMAPLHRGAIRPGEEEIRDNPRARSARLRAAIRTSHP